MSDPVAQYLSQYRPAGDESGDPVAHYRRRYLATTPAEAARAPEPLPIAPPIRARVPEPTARYDRFGEEIPPRTEEQPSTLERIATGVGTALVHDLPVGIAHFLSTPLRAVFAPETVEEARNPYTVGVKRARGGMSPAEVEADIHAAIRRRAASVQTPREVVGEAAAGLVTSGRDIQRAAMPGPTLGNIVLDKLTGRQTSEAIIEQEWPTILEGEEAGAKARAITNLVTFAGLLAWGAKAERATAAARITPAQVRAAPDAFSATDPLRPTVEEAVALSLKPTRTPAELARLRQLSTELQRSAAAVEPPVETSAAAPGVQETRSALEGLFRPMPELLLGERGSAHVAPDLLERPEPGAATPTAPPSALPPHSRGIQDQISVGEGSRGLPNMADLYQRVMRRTFPLERVAKRITRATGEAIPAHQDPGAAAMLAQGSGARAETFLEDGPFRFTPEGNTEPVGVPSYRQILDPLKGKLNALRRYEVAQRTLELAARERPIETGISVADARAELANVDPVVAKAHEQSVAFRNSVLDYWGNAGGASPEAVAALRAMNEHYVPLQRVFEGKDAPSAGAGQAGRVRQQIRRILGSQRRIIDPIETTVDATRRIIAAADRQRIGLTLVELAERFPEEMRGLIERDPKASTAPYAADATRVRAAAEARGIPLSLETAGELAAQISDRALTVADDVVRVWRNGKLETWRVAPELGKTLRSLSPRELPLWTRLAGLPARGLKAGVTLNPLFSVFNFVRDAFDATLQSDYGFKPWDSFKGFAESLRQGPRYREFRQGGADYASYYGRSRPATQAVVRRLVSQPLARQALGRVLHPVEALKTFARPFEQAARLGEFMRAREQGASVIEASLAASRVTTDFRHIGAEMQGLAHMTAFLNPALQSLDTMIRASVKNPKRLAVAGVTAIALPSAIFWALARVRRDQELIDLRKSRQGLIYWFLRAPGGGIIRIPKPFFYGQVFGTATESALDRLWDHDPEAGERLAGGLVDQAGTNIFPHSVGIYSGLKNNRDPFFQTPIVPPELEHVDPAYQVQPHTGTIARKFGQTFGVSPAKFEFLVRQLSGTLGGEVLREADRVLDRIARREPPTPVAADAAIVGRIFARTPSLSVQPVQTFYRNAARADEVVNTIRYLEENDPAALAGYIERHQEELALVAAYAPAGRQLGALRGVLEDLQRTSGGLTPAERRARIDEVTRVMVEIARTVNTATRDALVANQRSRRLPAAGMR